MFLKIAVRCRSLKKKKKELSICFVNRTNAFDWIRKDVSRAPKGKGINSGHIIVVNTHHPLDSRTMSIRWRNNTSLPHR